MFAYRTFAALLIVLTCVSTQSVGDPAQTPLPTFGGMGFNAPRVTIANGGFLAKPYIPLSTQKAPVKRRLARGSNQRQKTPNVGRLAAPITNSLVAGNVQSRGCAAASSQPAPIVALVSGLKCDPDLIFEYVYNNIEFEPLYGSNRGALGTLLDKRGDDADQAILLVSLFNTAGYYPTGFFNEGLSLTGTQIANWLGVPNDCNAIQHLLNAGGIPYLTPSCSNGLIQSIVVNHFVAALQLNGIWYYFDPSFKQHTLISGVSNLASVIGYSRSRFLLDAAGTISGGPNNNSEIVGVNRSNLRADLTTYANNLLNYNRTASLGATIGGQVILPLVGSPIRIQEPGWTPSPSFPVNCPNQSPSPECRSFVVITMNGESLSTGIKLYSDAVYGHRITITSVPGQGSTYYPTLLIDGAAPACVPSCANVGQILTLGQSATITTEYTQPNQPVATGCEGSTDTTCKNLNIVAGGTFLFSLSFGEVGRGMAEYHRQLLQQAVAQGNATGSEVVLGESLATISYNWIAQLSNSGGLLGRLTQTSILYHIAGGITGQWNIQQSGYQGPYIDLPVNFAWLQPWSSNGPTTTIGSYSYPTAFVTALMSFSEASSSFESAVLLETQAQISNMTAASTMMLVDANMNPSYSGSTQTTFFADGTTQAGIDYFNSTIYGAIFSKYSQSDSGAIQAAVLGGEQVLIPENGLLPVGYWTGAGYTTIFPQSTSTVTVTEKISGGMSGGFTGYPDPTPSDYVPLNLTPFASSDSLPVIINLTPAPFDPRFAEPIDSITGAYTYSHEDLVTGSSKFPYALPFSRTYISAAGTNLTTSTADVGFGNGWTSSYNISAQVTSDPYIAMGLADSPVIGATNSVVALFVMQDLLSSTPTAQTMTISTMVAHWFADQITNNVVQVSKPNTTEEYVALPHMDGATTVNFNPPPGASIRLSQTATNTFKYVTKDGVTLNFAPAISGAQQSALQSWIFPNGMNVNLSYNGSGQLGQITNNLGRSLTLSYTGNDVTTVTDDTGRLASYNYDGNHNLIKFTDPLLQNTTFSYDSSGVFDTAGHLTQIFYPANPANPFVINSYDPMGHVSTQANANGNVSLFYIAGTRSELVDALGNRHVTYQTDRGRLIIDAFVLSSTYGDVFNDTPQQNGVINITTNQYDGIDRLVLSTAPEGDSTAIAYDLVNNPWANNITSVTRSPKPNSGLQPITESFTYSPAWNKAVMATDGLGLVSINSYDTQTGGLLRSVADYGHFNATSLFAYTSLGQVLTSTDPMGAITQYGYDDFGNQASITRDLGDSNHLNQLTQMGYDDLGDVTSIIDPNNNETSQQFDANRQKKIVTAPLAPPTPGPLVTSYSYDPDGNLLQTQQSVSGTVLRTTNSTYTLTDKVKTTTDANQNTTIFKYDGDDRLASTSDPYQSNTSYGYDAMSRQIQVFNTAIQATPLLQKSYEPDGPVASLTDANNNNTTYAYDGFNRLAKTTYPAAGGPGTKEKYTYDADSNVLSFTSRNDDVLSYSYDTLNRLCTKTAGSVPTSCSSPFSSSPTTEYVYDLAGKLAATSDNSAAIQVATTAASYSTNMTYDSLNHPLTVSWSPAPAQATPSASNATFAFSYDKNDRRISQTTTNSNWWSYPTTAENIGYTTNALNQYTAVGSFAPLYNADGDLIADGTFLFGYDSENRMTSTNFGSQVVATYSYDALGRRKSKTDSTSQTTTVYVTDPDGREILEYDGSTGATNAWYAYGLGSNEVLNRMNVSTGKRDTLLPDIQGSIIGVLKSSGGGIAKTGYQTFGENASLSSGTFQYTGQRFDPETAGSASEPSGLYYYRSRMYSPVLGRYLQPDSIGYQGGMNLYAYVNNDPLNRTDPNGKCIEDFCVVEGILAYEGIEALFVIVEATEAAEGTVATATAASQALPAITASAQFGGSTIDLLAAENPLLSNAIAETGIATPLSWESAALASDVGTPVGTSLASEAEFDLGSWQSAAFTSTIAYGGLLAARQVLYGEEGADDYPVGEGPYSTESPLPIFGAPLNSGQQEDTSQLGLSQDISKNNEGDLFYNGLGNANFSVPDISLPSK